MSTRLAVRLWWDIICYTYSGRRMGTDREQGSSNNRSYQGHGRCEPLTLPCPQCPAADTGQSIPVRDLSAQDRKSTRLNSSHVKISYAVFCLKKKKKKKKIFYTTKKKTKPQL